MNPAGEDVARRVLRSPVVTPDRLDARIADVMAASETRAARWIVAAGGAVIAAMRFFAA